MNPQGMPICVCRRASRVWGGHEEVFEPRFA